MSAQKRFGSNPLALSLFTFLVAFPLTGYCVAAGRVDFASGNVELVGGDGVRHPLNKGSEINAGESISTGEGARAQVRFTDGGFISLQPNTLFRVEQFNYAGKANGEEKGFFSLLKGGLRAVTGVIGHLNKDNYRVTTPAATLGIRGTGYNMVLRDDGLFVNVGEGAISLTNNAGILSVTAGNAAFVADFNTAPAPTAAQPYTPPTAMQQPAVTVADQRTGSGGQAFFSMSSGPGYALAYVSTSSGGPGLPTNFTGVTTLFNASSQLVQYNVGTTMGALGAATVTFSATDGTIGWGRWVGNTAGTAPLTAGTFDYVVGLSPATMPITGTATYRLMGYTSPTATDGSTGYSVNGTLSADFALGSVGVNMNVANSTSSYAINTITAPLAITGSTFGGVVPTTSPVSCAQGCSTAISGFFAGTNASRAGLSYSIGVGLGPAIQGVAAFAKN
jgi:FecR protein